MQLDFLTLLATTAISLFMISASLPLIMGRNISASARYVQASLLLQALAWAAIIASTFVPATLADRMAVLRDAALASGQRAGLLLGAQVAQATNAPAPATQRLQDWVLTHPRDAQAWQVLAQLHQAQGQRLRALRAEGESRAAQLDFGSAAEHFKAAQVLPAADRAADPMELAIVDARRREVDRIALQRTPAVAVAEAARWALVRLREAGHAAG